MHELPRACQRIASPLPPPAQKAKPSAPSPCAHTDMERRGEDFTIVEEPALLRATELASLIVVPMALKAAINLKVMNILADHKLHDSQSKGEGLTASEIVFHINERYHVQASSDALHRILRLLASYGVFNSSQELPKDEEAEKQEEKKQESFAHTMEPSIQGGHTKYALNSVSRYFVPQDDSKEEKQKEEKQESVAHTKEPSPSHAPLLSTFLDKAFMNTWPFLEESILDSSLSPFRRAHGTDIYSYTQENPQFGMLFNFALGSHSKTLFVSLLENYQGFSSVKSLVDVGGGVGSCMQLIVSKYPHIHGVNFDLPHVVAMAPQYPGVEHVGGDMFESVPCGDAILIKATLHNWSDKDCVEILKNCYKALSNKGKVIIVEYVVPSNVDTQISTRVAYHHDTFMLTGAENAKERTFDEFKSLSKVAGFKSLQQVLKINEMVVLELYK